MARMTFRLNLGSAEFPFLSDLYGRSIVLPQQDMNYVRPNAFSGSEADKNIGIPQMIFCENVMPTSYGYQSVGFQAPVPATANADFDQAFYLRDVTENRTLFVPGVVGTTAKRYTYDPTTQLWSTSPKTIPSGAKATVSSLKNRTFVKFEFDDELFEWNAAWSSPGFTGLTAANIKGIVSANSYLIAYDYDTVYWSSTTDPLDFVPSLITGAGSQKILARKGRIVVCYPIEDGFVIYTTANVIVARYSKNARFPWDFKEIKNSAGIENQECATPQGNGSNFYQYSTNGMMLNTATKSEQEFSTLNEFLGRRRFENYNPTTRTFYTNDLNGTPPVKIEFVANRWLVISYNQTTVGVNAFTHALIFDTALKRWGKIKLDHVDCFEFFGNSGTSGSTIALTWAQLSGTWAQQNNTWADFGAIVSGGAASLTVPYRSLAFLRNDGSVRVVDFSWATTTDDAVMVIGRIQFLRDKLVNIQEVTAENLDATNAKTIMYIESTMDGRNVIKKRYPKHRTSLGKTQEWYGFFEGMTHNLVFRGDFDFNTVIARTTLGGKR